MAKQIVKTLEEAQELWPKIPFHANTIDLTNQTFNYLTGLYKTNNLGPNTGCYWVFKCKCGNYVKIKSSDVRTGKTKSCGCYQKEQTSKSSLKDLTGQHFGKLTVIQRDFSNTDEQTKWICQCECGNQVSVYYGNLVRGRTLSCGCYNKTQKGKDLSNQIFGFLQALEPTDKRSSECVVWKCKCLNCNTICYVRSSSLINGEQQSCGCIQSAGELQIRKILLDKQINFQTQYSFKDLRYKNPLKFDFALLDSNNNLLALLEYQGKQHYANTNNDYGKIQREITDPMKKEYCKQHNIKLFEIRYNENIKDKLKDILGELYGITGIIQAFSTLG